MRPLEIWTVVSPGDLGRVTENAQRVEQLGFTGIAFGDSQSRSGDTIVALTMAATSTSTLRISTAVTNPYTRHPASLACAFCSLQLVSGGRMTLGIGRGDSALAFLGLAPAPVSYFGTYLRALQAYLRGDEIDFDDLPPSVLPSSATLPLGERPLASSLRWLPPEMPKVPVSVAATGPRVIAQAAVLAEQIIFCVGADTERLAWAIDHARQARQVAGLDPDDLSFGAYVSVAVHDDVAEARRLGGGLLASLSRLTIMHGKIDVPVDETTRTALNRVREVYSMSEHAQVASPQGSGLSDEYADRFGIYGPPALVVDRLRELSELGLDRVFFIPPLTTSDPDGVTWSRIGSEVIPQLATGHSAPAAA